MSLMCVIFKGKRNKALRMDEQKQNKRIILNFIINTNIDIEVDVTQYTLCVYRLQRYHHTIVQYNERAKNTFSECVYKHIDRKSFWQYIARDFIFTTFDDVPIAPLTLFLVVFVWCLVVSRFRKWQKDAWYVNF